MRPKSAILVLLALASIPAVVAAAVQLPQASPAASITQAVGTTDLTLAYHRPAVKGRAIWGALVPLGEVWRLGANEATTLTVTDPVKIAGKEVAAGTYALFAIPGAERWTFILSRKAKQWGAFSYDAKDDLARFEAKVAPAPHTEWMTFSIDPAGEGAAEVSLAWEKVRLSFPVTVDVPAIVWRDLDAALAAAKPEDGDLFLQAARYARERGQRLAEAMTWIDRSIAARETWWNLETKADLLQDAGRTAEALSFLERALALSREKTPAGYQQGLEKKLADYRKSAG